MKCKLLIAMFVAGVFAACSDDDKIGFDLPVDVSQEAIRFTPAPGGAVMHYSLPEDKEVFGIRVRYNSVWGETVVKDGSYLNDSLLLDGFTEMQPAVSAQVSYFNRAMVETEPVEVTFATEKSATVALFDGIKVNSFWGGFSVVYDAPETVNGLIHVFYIGENPKTHEPDSILMASLAIVEGGDTINIPIQQRMDAVDVVVRTDDFKGRRVKQEVVKGVVVLTQDTLMRDKFDFRYTGQAVEDDAYKLGVEYLFDGDKKGKKAFLARQDNRKYEYYTFLTDGGTFDEKFVIDLKEEKVPAAINLYAFVCMGKDNYYYTSSDANLSKWWSKSGENYKTRLPSVVKVYGTNDASLLNADNEVVKSSAVLLASHTEDKDICALTAPLFVDDFDFEAAVTKEFKGTWVYRSDVYGNYAYDEFGAMTTLLDLGEARFDEEEPVCLNLQFNYTGATYRYLIMIIEDTFAGFNFIKRNFNEGQYVTLNELEVCVKAESNQ